MEGMSFDTPKGTMTFRKEDHQALQDMYHWRIKKGAKDRTCWSWWRRSRPSACRCRSRSKK